jgi:hypothetical protein
MLAIIRCRIFCLPAYRIIISPVVLCGCETWSLTLREERRLRVCESRVLRGIFGPKRDEVTGGCRRLFNQELNGLYSSPNNIRLNTSGRMRRVKYVLGMGKRRGWYGVLVGKPEGKSHLEERGLHGRVILKWILRMWGGGMDGIDAAQNRDRWWAFVNEVMNLRFL